MSGTKKVINWERIEIDYRAGIKTLREIADAHGITHGAITRRSKRDGWVRDLTAKIKAKADYLVSKSLVSNSASKEKRILESDIVNANAVNNATIDMSHRANVTEARNVAMSLLDELKDQIANRSDYEHLGDILRNPDQYGNDKLNDIYNKVISFAGRVDSTKKLSDALKTIIDLERRICKIDTDPEGDENKKVNLLINFK